MARTELVISASDQERLGRLDQDPVEVLGQSRPSRGTWASIVVLRSQCMVLQTIEAAG